MKHRQKAPKHQNQMSFRSNRSGILSVCFADGVTASARTLHVRQTYEGLVVGLPSPELNRRHIKSLRAQVRRVFGSWPVLVLSAEQEIIVRQSARDRLDVEIEAWLPKFELWSWFESDATRSAKMHGSCLSLVWHQAAPYPFIAPDVLPKMQAIRWFDVAEDFEF